MKNQCSRFSSNLITKDLLMNQNTTLKDELEFIIEKKRLNQDQKKTFFGINPDFKGKFFIGKKIIEKNDQKEFSLPANKCQYRKTV